MSLPNVTVLSRGQVNGGIYDFLKTGDILSMHDHPGGSGSHIIIVAKGSLLIRYSDERKPTAHPLGQVIDPDYPHELESLEDGTRTVHIMK